MRRPAIDMHINQPALELTTDLEHDRVDSRLQG